MAGVLADVTVWCWYFNTAVHNTRENSAVHILPQSKKQQQYFHLLKYKKTTNFFFFFNSDTVNTAMGACVLCIISICTVCVLSKAECSYIRFFHAQFRTIFPPLLFSCFVSPVFSSLCHLLSLLLAHSSLYPPPSPSLQPPPKTQIKGMMQTPRRFLMLDPFQASQLASGPGLSRKRLFIADLRTRTTTYAFNIHVQNKMWH